MSSDFEIGRVVDVDTAQVTIELNPDLRGLTRTTLEGAHEIGRINDYVVLPVGTRRLVGMVTRVLLTQEAALRPDRASVELPAARRLMKATLIGTISTGSFTQGVSSFPVLDNAVRIATQQDLSTIFDENQNPTEDDPGYCIELGTSALFENHSINIDPNAFFGKHAAVLGSTGSGKSSTIASLIQGILQQEEVNRTSIVILDTNGEYTQALADGEGSPARVIPSDPAEAESRLVVPYWFMTSEDFVRLFRASQGVQRPVLMRALQSARGEASPTSAASTLRQKLWREMLRMISTASSDHKQASKDVETLAQGFLVFIDDPYHTAAWSELELELSTLNRSTIRTAVETVWRTACAYIDNGFPRFLPLPAKETIDDQLTPIVEELAQLSVEGTTAPSSADRPAYFDKERFRRQHLEQVLRHDDSGSRARDYSGTMLLRIDQLFNDRRFEFLLGSEESPFPDADHTLATFLRDVIGLPSCGRSDLSDEQNVEPGRLPFYDRQRSGSKGDDVVIVDLSLLPADVLENVTALIGRLILDFLQRLGEHDPESRGSLPVVLALEEAQNYIPEHSSGQDESIAREVFERIAREGRKYGLGLVVASQRPSELSKTVLSQCSSFIVHRLQNPDDLSYFRQIVPSLFSPMLEQLPALAPQTALVLGEAVRAPALVKIRDADPVPRSRDPLFYRRWVADDADDIDVESIAARWEAAEASSEDTFTPSEPAKDDQDATDMGEA